MTPKKGMMMTTKMAATRGKRAFIFRRGRMKREHFIKVAEDSLDSLPEEFRSRIKNVAILVEDFPPSPSSPRPGQQRRLLLGIFHGVPVTKKSVFDLPTGPAHIVLYQKNIEAVCSSEAEVRHQIRPDAYPRTGALFRHDGGTT
jgi:predicted Zn-dependent protease with MMP-like domain